MNERKKPAIRFKGFFDEWEQHPMDELTTELHEYTTLDSSYPLLTSSREGIMFQNQYRSNRTTENGETLFSIVPYGKCTYRHMSDDDIFHFNINDIVENGLVSREYPVFDSTNGNDLRFIVALLNSSEQFRKFCRERKIGGTRTRLYYKDLSNFKPLCPEFDEQQSIAEFLDSITSIISHHQSKLKKLQALKASMLEKMFPKDGADVPEIRFKGFTKAWVKRKIGECFAERNESFPEGELLSVTINNGVRKFSELDRRDTSNSDKSKYKKVCVGDIAYNSMRMWQGASGYSPYEGIVSPAYTVLSPNLGIISECIAYYFKSNEMIHTFQINSQGITSDNWNLKFPTLSNIEIYVSPDIEEQKRIAAYFASFDILIQRSQQALNKFQSIKKALLEKMFV